MLRTDTPLGQVPRIPYTPLTERPCPPLYRRASDDTMGDEEQDAPLPEGWWLLPTALLGAVFWGTLIWAIV